MGGEGRGEVGICCLSLNTLRNVMNIGFPRCIAGEKQLNSWQEHIWLNFSLCI